MSFTDNSEIYQEYEILGRFCRKKTPNSVIPSMIPADAQIFSVYSNTYLKLPSPQEVPVKFGAFMEKLMKDVESMAGQVAQYSQEESRHEGNCRLEVRVPLSIHSTTLTTFPPRLALNGMARYHYTTWWYVIYSINVLLF